MNGAGPQTYASASRGGSSSASSDAVSRPARSKSRPSTSPGRGGCRTRGSAHRGARRPARGPRRRRGARGCCVRRAATRSLVGVRHRQRVEHGEHRGRPDAGADQQHGRAAPVEDEGAPRCRDLELVADRDPGVQVGAGRALRFAFDGDPVGAGPGPSRERVVAEHRAPAVGLEPQREVLAGARGRERSPPGSARLTETTESLSRSIAATFSRRNPVQAGGGLVAPGPRCRAAPSLEQGAERRLPARAERGDAQRAQQLPARVSGEVEERVDLGDRHLLRAGSELDDLVSRLHVALLEHPEVEPGAVVRDEQRGDARVVQADPTR